MYCVHPREANEQSSGWSEAEAGVCEERSEELATLVVVTSLRSETGTIHPPLQRGYQNNILILSQNRYKPVSTFEIITYITNF